MSLKINWLLASLGGKDSGALNRKGIFMEKFHQVISVITQVAISRRTHPYELLAPR